MPKTFTHILTLAFCLFSQTMPSHAAKPTGDSLEARPFIYKDREVIVELKYRPTIFNEAKPDFNQEIDAFITNRTSRRITPFTYARSISCTANYGPAIEMVTDNFDNEYRVRKITPSSGTEGPDVKIRPGETKEFKIFFHGAVYNITKSLEMKIRINALGNIEPFEANMALTPTSE